jgi:membrane-associated phospholipid phosphatase
MRHPPLRLVRPALVAGAALLTPVELAGAQSIRSLAPLALDVQPVFPSWQADDLSDAPALTLAPARAKAPSTVVLPELQWSIDGFLGAAALAGNAIGLNLTVPSGAVPEQGLDPAAIRWGIDRNIIGNPSTSAARAGDVLVNSLMLAPPILALATQPAVHGFGNIVRRPFVLYGEALLLAQACTQLLKPIIGRPRPFTYLPVSERPTGAGYDINEEETFLSMPSGHSTSAFAAAAYATTDNLFSRPDAGWGEHVAVASIGTLLAGFIAGSRIQADQHFPTDVVVGGLIGTASGVSVPLLHRYVLPGGRPAGEPEGRDVLVTATGYVVGVVAGAGLSALVY